MKTKLNLDEIQEFPLMITKPECLINFKLVKEIKANKIPDFQHQLCRSHWWCPQEQDHSQNLHSKPHSPAPKGSHSSTIQQSVTPS